MNKLCLYDEEIQVPPLWQAGLQSAIMKQPCVSFMDKVLCCVWVHAWLCVDMHAYLSSGSRILWNHWDSHSKQRKRCDGTFLHSDRRDYKSSLSLRVSNEWNYEQDKLLHVPPLRQDGLQTAIWNACHVSWTNCCGFGHAWLCASMWVMSNFVYITRPLRFQHILLCYRGYACDCIRFKRDSIERIYKIAIPFAHIYTTCKEKHSYMYWDTSARLSRLSQGGAVM